MSALDILRPLFKEILTNASRLSTLFLRYKNIGII